MFGAFFILFRSGFAVFISRFANWFSRTPKAFGILLVLLPGAVLVAVYWAGLHGGFFFDDEANVLLAEGVTMQEFSYQALELSMSSGHAGPFGRGVAQLSFAINYYFAGFEPFAFKATNLAIHAVNGLLVYFVCTRILAACYPTLSSPRHLFTAALLAIFWVLHPIQLTTVLLVVQRMTSLSAFFLLAALLLHMRGRDSASTLKIPSLLFAWCVLWPLSVLSKESGILFPMFVWAWEITIRRTAVGRSDAFARLFSIVLSMAVMLGVAYAFSQSGQWLWSGYEFRSFSLSERLMTEGRVLWFYLGLIVLPTLEGLALHHDYLVVSSGMTLPWTTVFAWLGIGGLLWLAWHIRHRWPMFTFGVAWFFIGHALESTVLPLEVAHEHRNYLPLLGVLLAVAAGLHKLTECSGTRKTVGVTMLCAALAYFSLITSLRSHQFADEMRRVQIEVQHHPDSARAHYEAGQVFLKIVENSGDDDLLAAAFARRHFERAMALDPSFKMGGFGLIVLECRSAKRVQTQWYDELLRRFRETPFLPGDTAFFYGLKELLITGRICLETHDVEALFSTVLENPKVSRSIKSRLYSWQADYFWLAQQNLAAAKRALGKSLELVPSNQSNRLKWAQLLYLGGDLPGANHMLREVQENLLSSGERNTLVNLLLLIKSEKQ